MGATRIPTRCLVRMACLGVIGALVALPDLWAERETSDRWHPQAATTQELRTWITVVEDSDETTDPRLLLGASIHDAAFEKHIQRHQLRPDEFVELARRVEFALVEGKGADTTSVLVNELLVDLGQLDAASEAPPVDRNSDTWFEARSLHSSLLKDLVASQSARRKEDR